MSRGVDVARLLGGREPSKADFAFGGVLAAFGWWYLTNLNGALSVDETFYARSGLGLLTGDPYQNPTHAFAPTAKYLIGAGQLIFGNTSVGIRLPVALCALATLVVTYRLGTTLQSKLLGLFTSGVVGGTFLFAHHATIGVLDVPLVLFALTGVYAAVHWFRERDRRLLFVLGVAAAAATTTKAYGMVYAVVPIAAVFIVLVRERGFRRGLGAAAPTVVGGIGTLALVYLPYVFVPHPPVGGTLGSGGAMAAARTLLAIPVIGNFVYIFGVGFVTNVLHVGGGHTVTIGGTVYQHAPLWTYFYWVVKHGGYVYGLLFTAAVAGSAVRIVTDRDPEAHLLCWSLLVPLASLTLLTVKFPRYILPLFPLAALTGGVAFARVADALSASISDALPMDSSEQTYARTGIVLVLAVVLVATTPAGAPFDRSVSDPLRTDTRYDDAVEYVESYAATSDDETVVLTYHYQTYRYYRSDDVAIRTIPLKAYAVGNNASHFRYLREFVERGEVDLVVATERNERLRSTVVGRCIREHGSPLRRLKQSPDGDQLIVYELPDDPVDC
jgi:4-amino-4-deoxy-L-arabinose transferase-like glycosyltransferase